MKTNLLCLFLFLAGPASASAQTGERAPVSRLTGITLPAGAQRILDKDTASQAVKGLDGLAAQFGRTCSNAEVLLWTSPALPSESTAVAAVTRSLEKAGYSCMVTDPAAGMPAALRKILVARSAKQTVLGYWAGAEGMLTLAWAQIGSSPESAAAEAAPVPDDSLPRFPKLKRKAGSIVGIALRADGKPLPGVEVVIRGTTLAGERTGFTINTGSSGRYELPLVPGVYRLSMATYSTRYNGMTYRLPLRTESGRADTIVSKQGGIGNWALLLRGPVPESDLRYGGTVSVEIADARTPREAGWPPGSVVRITLTPIGPLADARMGRPVTARAVIPEPSLFVTSGLLEMEGVPVGRYDVSASIQEPGKSPRALQAVVEVLHPNIPVDRFPAGAKPLYFYPREAGGIGVDRSRLKLQP